MDSKKYNLIFFGTPSFSAKVLNGLINSQIYQVVGVVTNQDKPAGRGKKLTLNAVKELAIKKSIEIFQPTNLRKEILQFQQWYNHLKDLFGTIDIGVVVAFGQILPPEVLSFFPNGCINIHASILPRWRGAAPINRAIMAGDTHTGVALMQMDAGLDTGPVFIESKIAINVNEIASELHDRLAVLGTSLLLDSLHKIIDKKIYATPQIKSLEDEKLITYANKISNEELKINWNTPAKELMNFIHGLAYYPGAFTFFESEPDKKIRLKIFRVIEGPKLDINSTYFNMPAGTIISADNKNILIKANHQDTLYIKEAQLEGKKIMPIDQILLGFKFHSGQVLQ